MIMYLIDGIMLCFEKGTSLLNESVNHSMRKWWKSKDIKIQVIRTGI